MNIIFKLIKFSNNFVDLYIVLLLPDYISAAFACDQTYQMGAVQSTYLTSPNYPGRYSPGSSCMYTIVAPANSYIQVTCDIKLDATSNNCDTDRLYIETEGEKSLARAEFFCGSGNIIRSSIFNSITIAYTSNSANYAGSFRCDVKTFQRACECGWSATVCLINFN